jgi:dipeptidyl aminopeptidase/acylaminoacyl peptidase
MLPEFVLSPNSEKIMLVSWEQYPSIRRVAEPYLKLAGLRLEPKNRSRHDTPGGYGIPSCVQNISILDISSQKEISVHLPQNGCISGMIWNADGTRFVFVNTAETSVELWLGDMRGSTKQMDKIALNPMLGSAVQWLSDQKNLLVKTIAEQARPLAPATALKGPSIQETDGSSGESSTYEKRDTLNNKNDEDLFETYGTSQLAIVNSETGKTKKIGEPGVYSYVEASPDGNTILVRSIQRPYSYITTYANVPHHMEVWTREGRVTTIAKLPLADRIPIHGVPTGPRGFSWRPTDPATLLWSEALDGGDWNVNVPFRDRVMTLKPPFTGMPRVLLQTEQRFGGFDWTENPKIALLYEYDTNRHWKRTFVVNVDDTTAKPDLLWDMSSDEQYNHPGYPVNRWLHNGWWVVRLDGNSIFLAGKGATDQGNYPFLDRLDLVTKKSERLFLNSSEGYESFFDFANSSADSYFTIYQSPNDPPNMMLRKVGASGAGKPITHVKDPSPELRKIKKRLVKYKRKDGVNLSFTLYTPPDYKEGTRIPAILNAYPTEYTSSQTAGQLVGSERTFARIKNYKLLLLEGYAIIDQASFPVIGDPKKAYDTFTQQLIDDAEAAVDKAVELGVVDRDRIGVTGHSHGALMTVSLLANTQLFKAGVATSGSYNKTLTPFGFQSERRTVWKAPEVYLKASPFFLADKIKTPLLLIHGADDANPGTTPLQAEKMYEAVRAHGCAARLVMLPYEPHVYSAMESIEQLLYEEVRWFNMYSKPVKN